MKEKKIEPTKASSSKPPEKKPASPSKPLETKGKPQSPKPKQR